MIKLIAQNLLVVATILLAAPGIAWGAQGSFELSQSNNSDGQVAVIEVKVDPQGKTLNVIEGTIVFEGEPIEQLSVEVETGGSVLTIWTTQPQYLPEEKAIRFVGGIPGGFDEKSLLFRMRLFSPVAGEVKINWVHAVAYLNDGQGTKEPVFSKSMKVSLNPSLKEELDNFSTDTQPPIFDAVEIGRDQYGAYDNKYFISFNAKDDVSGVDRYEVKEGESITVVTDGVYVLRDQSRSLPISITVYDKAGNSTVVNIPAVINWQKYIIIILVLIISMLAFYVYKRGKK